MCTTTTGKALINLFKYRFVLCNALPKPISRDSSSSSKSDLKIKWIRPEKIPSYKPAKSGDLEPMASVDLSRYQPDFQNCKELETADDRIRRLFTLEFAPRCKTTFVYRTDIMKGIQRHPYDFGSLETRIAKWTGAIRAMQDVMERFPRRVRLRVRLQELIDKRRKHLKQLRMRDYKKFEWLIEKLNIVYKPPAYEYCRVTRKGSMRKLTLLYCEDLVAGRLNEYKLKLQEEQPAFLQEKIRSLEFIRDEERECGVPVTVQQEEIDEVRKQLEKLLEEKEEQIKED